MLPISLTDNILYHFRYSFWASIRTVSYNGHTSSKVNLLKLHTQSPLMLGEFVLLALSISQIAQIVPLLNVSFFLQMAHHLLLPLQTQHNAPVLRCNHCFVLLQALLLYKNLLHLHMVHLKFHAMYGMLL